MSIEDKIKAGIGWVSVGIIGTIIAIGFYSRPNVDEARVFQREEGKPAVIRMYKPGRDGILVEDKENKGKYIQIDEYLGNIPDKSDREIEEATIKKLIDWYK